MYYVVLGVTYIPIIIFKKFLNRVLELPYAKIPCQRSHRLRGAWTSKFRTLRMNIFMKTKGPKKSCLS